MEIGTIIAVIGTIAAVIGTGIALAAYIGSFLRNIKIDLNAHIDRLEKRMDAYEANTLAQNERTDRLYQMFVDLLKNQKPKTNP